MGYALFAQRKVELDGLLNNYQLQQTQRSNEQNSLATDTLNLQQQLSSMQSQESSQLAELYELLANDDGSNTDTINAKINALKASYDAIEEQFNREINQVSIKENAVEMEVKRLDTEVTTIEKQLEAVEEAEGDGIEKATPKFNGIG